MLLKLYIERVLTPKREISIDVLKGRSLHDKVLGIISRHYG